MTLIIVETNDNSAYTGRILLPSLSPLNYTVSKTSWSISYWKYKTVQHFYRPDRTVNSNPACNC